MACKTPITIKLHQPKEVDGKLLYTVPIQCGKCNYCKRQRITGWSFRLMHEEKQSNNAYFVTLTYDTENIPYYKIDEKATKRNGKPKYTNQEIIDSSTRVPTLRKADLQKFMKLLRKYDNPKRGQLYKQVEGEKHLRIINDQYKRNYEHTKFDKEKPLRYYAVGEYGSKNFRPHYHLIIYNLYDQETIQEQWKHGEVDVKPIHENSIIYLLKYLEKESKHYKRIYKLDLQREFSLSSKKLGACYIDIAGVERYHMSSYDNNTISLPNGVKGKIPRYLHEKMYLRTKTKDRHILSSVQKHIKDEYLRGLYKHIIDKIEAEKQFQIKAMGNGYYIYQQILQRNSHIKKTLKKRD